MSKKLLSEAQVRRFAKLANLSPINEMYKDKSDKEVKEAAHEEDKVEEAYYKKDDDVHEEGMGHDEKDEKSKLSEDAMEDIEDQVDDELPGGEEVEMKAGEDEIMDDEPAGDLDAREEMAMDVINAVADALNIEVDIDDDGDDMGDDLEMDDELDVEMDDEADDLMEALSGITYVPSKQEIVNEVAKRVAKRLLEAKKADARLQEALGNRRRPRRKK